VRDALLPDSIETIPGALDFWAEQTPDAPALIVPGSPAITYAAQREWVRTFGAALRQAGIGPHDRIVVLIPEGHTLALALLGTMSAAIAVPVAAESTVAEVSGALRGLRATAAMVSPTTPVELCDWLSVWEIPPLELDVGSVCTAPSITGSLARMPCMSVQPRAEDAAFVLQTSGTSGTPKRVPRTHGAMLAAARQHRDLFSLTPNDRALSVAPMTLALGLTTLLYGVVAGSSLVFPPSLELTPLWQTILEQRPTWMFPPSGFLEVLARRLRRHPELPRPSSFRFVRVTSGPIASESCEALADRFGAPILPSYSSSEAGLIAAALPPPARSKPGSVGIPVLEMRLVDADGNDVGATGTGEIVLRAPDWFPGYLDDPERNAAAFMEDGWFRTGDIGYRDHEGFLFLTGRRSELINRGGEKIAPADVDAALREHPAVADMAAFAVPDARLGEDVVAAVVTKPGTSATARELRSWMLDRLALHKAPRRIWFVETIPRTASGKVQRSELTRRWVAEGSG
jgi:oxalate---CoA ligase